MIIKLYSHEFRHQNPVNTNVSGSSTDMVSRAKFPPILCMHITGEPAPRGLNMDTLFSHSACANYEVRINRAMHVLHVLRYNNDCNDVWNWKFYF